MRSASKYEGSYVSTVLMFSVDCVQDKWKTLVHTASIAPQQRRGEPVPQDLLDRVMSAHADWSQHQAKQQGKHQSATLKIANEQADRMVIEGM